MQARRACSHPDGRAALTEPCSPRRRAVASRPLRRAARRARRPARCPAAAAAAAPRTTATPRPAPTSCAAPHEPWERERTARERARERERRRREVGRGSYVENFIGPSDDNLVFISPEDEIRCALYAENYRPPHRQNQDFIRPMDENSIFHLLGGRNLDFVYPVDDWAIVLTDEKVQFQASSKNCLGTR
jgi:hypothetical protein